MKRNQFLVVTTTALAALLGAATGCGDNSHDCGTGTKLDDKGYCVPDGEAGAICGDGTVLDAPTNTCVPSDTVCGNGTVLVDGKCQDPTGGLTIDVEEGPEPNGFEPGATPAGVVPVKPVGSSTVIHGCVRPVNGAFDIDDYTVTVTQPTLLEITADGVQGLAAAFLVFGNQADPDQNIANYTRVGMNLATDMSQRQLWLPKAGTYDLLITDSRTVLPILDGAQNIPAAGNPDADTTCYYVTVEQKTPAPVALNLATGDTGTIGKDVKFYSATLSEGFNEIAATIDSNFAQPSLVLMQNNAVRQINDGNPDSDLFFAGVKSTDTPVIVLDYVYNYDIVPPNYTVSVVGQGVAQPLSRTGASVSEMLVASSFTDIFSLNEFYYDVTAANEIDGFNLSWNTPVDGVVVDQDGFILANFTFDGGFFGDTWTDYQGLMRHPAPGRYYFLVYDPSGTPGTDTITATSTINVVTPTAVVEGTPLTAQMVDANAKSNAFTYNAGTTDAWQQFDATGTGTGAISLAFFDPATAYGRLDALPSASFIGSNDVAPLFAPTIPQAGGPVGHITLDDPSTNYLVTVNTATTTGTPTFNLSFSRRPHTDFGTLPNGATTALNQPLTTAAPVQRYLFRTPNTSTIAATVHPDNVLLNTQMQFVNANEVVLTTTNNGIAGADDTRTFVQTGNGWTAITVSSSGALPVAGTNTFDLTLNLIPPPYAVGAGTTTFADACAGGTMVTTVADGTGNGPADDEGLSAPITPPTGFDYFGAAAPAFKVSTNGFLAFGTATAAAFSNADMPSASNPNGVVAPSWDDLEGVVVCQKTVGTKLIIQWTGNVFFASTTVQFQAILDGATDTIEFVYGPNMQATGSTSTVGVENVAGTSAVKIGFNTAVITPNSSKLLTPQ